MTKMVSVAGTLAFLLEDNPETESVTPQMVLHAVARKFTERTRYMPEGMTYADAWMARYGDPLASTEAALLLAREAGVLEGVTLSVAVKFKKANAALHYADPKVTEKAEAPSLPLAVSIAALNHAAAKESTI